MPPLSEMHKTPSGEVLGVMHSYVEATGPALEAFSQHPVVRKADFPGDIMSVSQFLEHVRRMVVDFVVGRVLAKTESSHPPGDGEDASHLARAERLDDVTTYYLLHRNDFGLQAVPAGACILYATACGLSVPATVVRCMMRRSRVMS